jgi:hypothetical protein
MADKKHAGRPLKGSAVRSRMLSVRLEPWVVASLDEDRREGESRADVLTRWASMAKHDNQRRGNP